MLPPQDPFGRTRDRGEGEGRGRCGERRMRETGGGGRVKNERN